MRFEKLKTIKPLTKLMLELLQDFYNREKNHLDAINFYDPELIKGLLDRKLIEVKQVAENDEHYCMTALGKQYVKHYLDLS